jgi:hypothetical protein
MVSERMKRHHWMIIHCNGFSVATNDQRQRQQKQTPINVPITSSPYSSFIKAHRRVSLDLKYKVAATTTFGWNKLAQKNQFKNGKQLQQQPSQEEE